MEDFNSALYDILIMQRVMAYEIGLLFLIHVDCFCVFHSLSSGSELWFVYVEYVIMIPFYQSPTYGIVVSF